MLPKSRVVGAASQKENTNAPKKKSGPRVSEPAGSAGSIARPMSLSLTGRVRFSTKPVPTYGATSQLKMYGAPLYRGKRKPSDVLTTPGLSYTALVTAARCD